MDRNRPVAAIEVDHDDPEVEFVGTFHWQSGRQTVEAGGETCLRRLRPALVPWFGGGRPALVGTVVVPYAPIPVEYVHPREGVVWRRRTAPTFTRTVLRIDESEPR